MRDNLVADLAGLVDAVILSDRIWSFVRLNVCNSGCWHVRTYVPDLQSKCFSHAKNSEVVCNADRKCESYFESGTKTGISNIVK